MLCLGPAQTVVDRHPSPEQPVGIDVASGIHHAKHVFGQNRLLEVSVHKKLCKFANRI